MVGVAVKVTLVPEQMVLPLLDAILTPAVTVGFVVTVMAFEVLVHPFEDVAVTE